MLLPQILWTLFRSAVERPLHHGRHASISASNQSATFIYLKLINVTAAGALDAVPQRGGARRPLHCYWHAAEFARRH